MRSDYESDYESDQEPISYINHVDNERYKVKQRVKYEYFLDGLSSFWFLYQMVVKSYISVSKFYIF